MKVSTGLAALLIAAGCASGTDDVTSADDAVKSNELKPDGRGQGTVQKFAHGGGGTNGISYHGGPVLHSPIAYYIYYGTQWKGSTQAIVEAYPSYVGGSAYFNINTTYTDPNGPVQNDATFGGHVNAPKSYGASLSDAQIEQVVADTLKAGLLPFDPNAVYFVLTSPEVTASSGFCTQYCGWHNHASYTDAAGAHDVKYAFVGNPDRCPSSCEAQTTSPNGDAGADGMVSIIAHEFEEAATDPDLNAWYDRRGNENADKCAWTFGSPKTLNGAQYNLTLNGMNFLVQQNWVNAGGGYCSMSF
jgi:hypothetical protein